MTSTDLTRWMDYRRAARARHVVAGHLAISDMARLTEASERPSDESLKPAQARLAFFEDEQRWARVHGRVQCAVSLVCGRCLRTADVFIDTTVAVVVVGDAAQAAAVPRADEPTLADGEWLDVHALVEDEILLALPGAVFCARADCGPASADRAASADAGSSRPSGRYPFADLRASPISDQQDDTNDCSSE